MSRYEILLAGEGGRGLKLMGLVLAEALALHHNQKVVMTVHYTPQQRGGLICTEVIVSPDEEIDYPRVLEVDLLVALSRQGFDQCSCQVKQDATIIADLTFETSEVPDSITIKFPPLGEVSQKVTGSEINANMVALGVISSLTGIVSAEALFATLKARVPPEDQEASRLALEAGISLGEKLK